MQHNKEKKPENGEGLKQKEKKPKNQYWTNFVVVLVETATNLLLPLFALWPRPSPSRRARFFDRDSFRLNFGNFRRGYVISNLSDRLGNRSCFGNRFRNRLWFRFSLEFGLFGDLADPDLVGDVTCRIRPADSGIFFLFFVFFNLKSVVGKKVERNEKIWLETDKDHTRPTPRLNM